MRSLSTSGLTNKEALLHIVFVSLVLTANISFMESWWGGRRQHREANGDLFLRLAFQARILNFTIFYILFIKGVFLIFFSSFAPSLILEFGQSHSWPEIHPQIITHSLYIYLYLSIYLYIYFFGCCCFSSFSLCCPLPKTSELIDWKHRGKENPRNKNALITISKVVSHHINTIPSNRNALRPIHHVKNSYMKRYHKFNQSC